MQAAMKEHYTKYYVTAAKWHYKRGEQPPFLASPGLLQSPQTPVGPGALRRADSLQQFYSDSDHSEGEVAAQSLVLLTDDELEAKAQGEFADLAPLWQNHGRRFNWRRKFSEHPKLKGVSADEPLDVVRHLFWLPILEHYKELIDMGEMGFFPHIGFQTLGRNLSEAFSERCISAAGQTKTVDRLNLGDVSTEQVHAMHLIACMH
jgi:hypothetical protein